MHYAACHAHLFRVLISTLLCSSYLLATQAIGKGIKPAQNWREMARLYQESSVFVFKEILAALQMDVTEFANKSRLHEDHLRSYLHGELFLDEMELDMIDFFVKDAKEIVHKFYGDDALSLNVKARTLLYGRADEAEFRRYAQIETTVQELSDSGEELTAEQQQLVDKVNAIRNDAFARIEHAVSLADINYYNNQQQTSQAILITIITHLKLSVAELAQRATVNTATIAAHQRGEITFAVDDVKKINTVLKYTINALPPKLRKKKRHRRPQIDKNKHARIELELLLKLLWRDFNDAVRVERYLHDSRRRQE